MRDFIRMVSVLFLACGLAAGSLAVVNAMTKKPIADHERQVEEAALREVLPEADEFRAAVPDGARFKDVVPEKVWEAFSKGEKAGNVFRIRAQGYSGPIALMFGTDATGAITGLRVLNHTETPGLGAKVATAQFRDQFKGKRAEQLILKKSDPARGQIDAVTGATISSRAVTKTVRSTLEASNKEKAGGDK